MEHSTIELIAFWSAVYAALVVIFMGVNDDD